MAEISQWSKTASNNVTVSPDGANLGWTGSQVGPWARETMAQVASWYQDPLFTSFLKDLNPENTVKTVTVTAADTITISNFDSSPVAHFPVGRFMQIVTNGGDIHPGFVASAPSYDTVTGVLTVVFDFITAGLTFTPSADLVSQEGVQFAITSESASSGNYSKSTLALGGQLIGAAILGGGGTTAERDAKFPVAPSVDGILWSNSTTRYLEVSVAGLGVVADADILSGRYTVVVASTAGMRVGQPISTASAAVIPAGTTIQSIKSPTKFLLSQAPVGTDASADITVSSAWLPASERLSSTGWASGSGDQGRAYIDDRDGKFKYGFQTSATSALGSAMDDTETIVPLLSGGATGFPPSGSVLIETEQIFYPVISGDNLGTNNYPCIRGYNSTAAAPHLIATAVDAQDATRSLTPGAGFGLDADTLDGSHRAEIIADIFAGSVSAFTNLGSIPKTYAFGDLVAPSSNSYFNVKGHFKIVRNDGQYAICAKWGWHSSASFTGIQVTYDTTVPFTSLPAIFLSNVGASSADTDSGYVHRNYQFATYFRLYDSSQGWYLAIGRCDP